ncbi:MAG TPA: outer membrane protein transport protein [Steroidobacteraceae bacterium]|nr:outer membrane protein transport protein [Steroidobacteraceae bacterium]
MHVRDRGWLVPATASLVLIPVTAGASGFALLEQSASRLGTAFAGTAAAADDATTVFFNPAGMTALGAPEGVIAASGIDIGSEFRDGGSAPAFAQPLGGNGGDAGGWNFVPAGYFVVPAGDALAFGIGVNAPFGLKLVYDEGWIGRFQALHSEISTLNVNPSIAFRVGERISLGAGLNYQRLDAELTNDVNYSAVVAQGVQQLVVAGQLSPAAAAAIVGANAGLAGHARVRGDDDAWGFNVGALFELSDRTSVGLAYRSSIDYKVGGTIAFAAPVGADPVASGIIAAASAAGAPLSSGAVKVDLEVPDSATLSVQHRFGEKYALLADIAWTGWSSIQELRIVRDSGTTVSVTPERWKDTWRYALGATYEMSDQLTLRAGVAFDETPVPDATRTPRLPDTDRTWVAIGARWQPSTPLQVDFGYAHLFSDTVPLAQDAGNVAASALLMGKQHSDINIVSAQLVYRF